MTYLDDASVRERMYRAYNRRAAARGASTTARSSSRILELRKKKAQLLGFRGFCRSGAGGSHGHAG